MPRVPKGWSIVYSGDDKDKAMIIARANRAKGYQAKVVVDHSAKALSGRGYTDYRVIVKRSSVDLEKEFQERRRG